MNYSKNNINSKPSDLKAKKILIIEDQPIIQKLLTIFCDRSGFMCGVSDNAKSGYEMAIVDSYNLIITDINLPGEMSGIDFIIAYRIYEKKNNLPRLPIIANSANDYKIEAIEAGANYFLEKPFDLGLLEKVVSSIFTK